MSVAYTTKYHSLETIIQCSLDLYLIHSFTLRVLYIIKSIYYYLVDLMKVSAVQANFLLNLIQIDHQGITLFQYYLKQVTHVCSWMVCMRLREF